MRTRNVVCWGRCQKDIFVDAWQQSSPPQCKVNTA